MFERVPPHNIDAEKAVLGSMLMDNQMINEIDGRLQKSDFYITAHQEIFTVIEQNYKTKALDLITVCALLKEKGKLDSCGGTTFIADIIDNIPSAANIVHYAEIVKENSLRRQLLMRSYLISEMAYSTDNISECIEKAQKSILSVNPISNDNIIKTAREVAKETFYQIEEQSKNEGLLGLSTGLKDLDNLTSGLCPGELTIIAGRPSMGKSCLAGNIADAAGTRGEASLIVSIEMPNNAIMIRFLASRTNIEARQLRKGFVREGEWPKLTAAAGNISEAKIYFDDSPLITPTELRMRARKAKKEYDIKLLVLDYMQIMVPGGNHKNREQEVSDISRTLKSIARELNIPVIGVSQLNRGVDSRPNKRPLMSDLRESGAIEQDADLILFIYREEVYDKRDDNPEKGIAEISIGKQRHGPTATIKTAFSDKYQKFSDMGHDDYRGQSNFGYND
jgi:replicative DNA helicase